jgi:hypothetical protein
LAAPSRGVPEVPAADKPPPPIELLNYGAYAYYYLEALKSY